MSVATTPSSTLLLSLPPVVQSAILFEVAEIMTNKLFTLGKVMWFKIYF